jgi:signal transduction histidine kinase
MNGILSFAELLIAPNLTGEEQQDSIRTIQLSGESLLTTIKNIVDISKIESNMNSVYAKLLFISCSKPEYFNVLAYLLYFKYH